MNKESKFRDLMYFSLSNLPTFTKSHFPAITSIRAAELFCQKSPWKLIRVKKKMALEKRDRCPALGGPENKTRLTVRSFSKT